MKAIPTDITALGFDPAQFGSPEAWDVNGVDGYLFRVLSDAAVLVRAKVGASVYDGASPGSLTEVRLRHAEIYFTAAELWRRMEQFQASNAAIGRGGDSAPPTISSRFLETASKYEERAFEQVELALSAEGLSLGVGSGIVQTGHHSPVTV